MPEGLDFVYIFLSLLTSCKMAALAAMNVRHSINQSFYSVYTSKLGDPSILLHHSSSEGSSEGQ